MKFKDLNDNGKIDWYEKVYGIFEKTFTIFAPIAKVGLSIAAAITKDPKVLAANRIVDAASPILTDILTQVDSGEKTITVDPVKAQALLDAVVENGSAVNAE